MRPRIAFTAPLKPPDHPTPSGDRTMARAVMAALGSWAEVDLISRLRTRDGAGDRATQDQIMAESEAELDRLQGSGPWDAVVTYHSYYKAPDLIGPSLARARSIPYAQIEASRAKKRLTGPWSRFAEASEAASDAADVIFYLTGRDLPALEIAKPAAQRLVHLRPYLDRDSLPPPKPPVGTAELLAVGMFRPGDKTASYAALARALHLVTADWRLTIAGDGEAAREVRALFAPFGNRIRMTGALPPKDVPKAMRQARALVWPGVNEAFGMVYLEAQALGLTCIAEDRPGVRDVIAPTGHLTPQDDPPAFACAIDAALATPEPIAATRRFIADRHLRGAAAKTLATTLLPLIGGRP